MHRMIREITEELNHVSTEKTLGCAHSCLPPDRKAVVRIIKNLQALLFPLCFSRVKPDMPDEELLEKTAEALTDQIRTALCFDGWGAERGITAEKRAEELTECFCRRLPAVKSLLLKDVEALYEGDPAAKRREEIMICYPGFYAISIFRLAHELHLLQVPLIPRVMTEYAHEKTGIDIHPATPSASISLSTTGPVSWSEKPRRSETM